MYQTSGDFSIQLPDGEWRLAVDRGLETIPVFKTFEVSGDNDLTLEIELERWINLPASGWWSGDVHVHHPTLKDSHRQFLLSYARARDLHVVNALEMGHHQGTDFKQAGFGEKFRVHDGDYWMASGQEEPRSTFDHIIGLNTTALARDLGTWFQNLKAGHTFVSNGPALEFTVDDHLPGSELARKAGDKVRIKARVLSHPAIGIPTSLTLVGNQGVLLEVVNPDKAKSLIIDLERTIDQSQWLVVSTVCDNNALAHSSPVYVKVDDRPTWCPNRGPDVIRKQLESIENIAREFTPASDTRAKGIHERLNRARDYYGKLLTKMAAYSASKR